jgi:hypothetical protein
VALLGQAVALVGLSKLMTYSVSGRIRGASAAAGLQGSIIGAAVAHWQSVCDALRYFLARKAFVSWCLQDVDNGALVGPLECSVVGAAAAALLGWRRRWWRQGGRRQRIVVGVTSAAPSDARGIGGGIGGSMSAGLWWSRCRGGRLWWHIRESAVVCWLCWASLTVRPKGLDNKVDCDGSTKASSTMTVKWQRLHQQQC